MADDLVTELVPILSRSLETEFNVFDVMHHGTHEKQISNVFGWLLDVAGSHRLGDTFLRIFIDEVNRGLGTQKPFASDAPYRVRQEVNTSPDGAAPDIADLVLENASAVIVIENYFTSDGHGHFYEGYHRFGSLGGRHCAVVLLCRDEDRSLMIDGWEEAPVLTYGALMERLLAVVDLDRGYKERNSEAYAFLMQMHRKFMKGQGRMEDRALLDFVVAMCDTGEARRYGQKSSDLAAEQFARDLSQQAQERFGEGREVLRKVKDRVRAFATQSLRGQLDDDLGAGTVQLIKANWVFSWQWSVILELAGAADVPAQEYVALMFGPTAWFQKQQLDPDTDADYSRIFVYGETFAGGAKHQHFLQSTVTLQETLDGIPADDARLLGTIVQLLSMSGRRSPTAPPSA